MKMIKIQKYAPIILILSSIVFVMSFYGDVVLSPNSYLFTDTGDGIKNYFTYASHIKNDSSYINSQIMNYPYGENFLFLDCQPLFTGIIKILSVPFPSIQNYSIGIINFLMIFSLVLSTFFLYLILLEFNVSRLFSVLGAFSIAVLAPQLFRVTGHLALSYSFFIPLSWYLFIKFSKSPNKLKWAFMLFLNNLSWYFVHAYLGMIAVSFMLLCFIFDFILFDGKKYKTLKQWINISLVVVLPFVFFWMFTIVTDHHVGRTDNPYGYLIYASNFESVFLPNYPPLRPFLDEFLKIEQNWEGLAYIGIGSILSIFLFVFFETVKFIKRKIKKESVKRIDQPLLVVALCSALILLFLSMGYPFKYKMEFLLDGVPIIKNFRGIGRFSWVFYYVVTVVSIYYVDIICNSKKNRVVYMFLGMLIPLSYVVEGIPYHREISNTIVNSSNLFDKNQLPQSFSNGLKYMVKDKYQAIIPLPFYHVGSENYARKAMDKICKISMILSYHSGLPLMGNHSARASLMESRNLLQLFSPNFYRKEVEKSIKSKKTFLIIYSNEELAEQENEILERSNLLYSNKDYSLYSISYDSLFNNTSRQEILNFERIKNKLYNNTVFLASSSDTSSKIIYNSYENMPEKKSHSGVGAYIGMMCNYNLLGTIAPNVLKENTEYVASFWMYNAGNNYGQDALSSTALVQTKDEKNSAKWIATTNPANSFVIDGAWSLVELTFKVTDKNDKVEVLLKGDDCSLKTVIIDDLLVREKYNDVYRVVKETNGQVGELFKNNHKIKNN